MWSWVTNAPLERLERPPIVEVICGVIFESIDIDPVTIGAFWSSRRAEYPTRQFLPALAQQALHVGPDGAVLAGPTPRVRTWLVSSDESRVLQFQHDRFYLNWRARGEAYPRFSGDTGLRAQALAEFGQFRTYCRESLSADLKPTQIELGKVDLMLEGTAWNGTEDLYKMSPRLATWLQVAEGSAPACAIRLNDTLDGDELQLAVDTTLSFKAGMQEPLRGVKTETTVRLPCKSDAAMSATFDRANQIANSLFAMLIPAKERSSRFGGPLA